MTEITFISYRRDDSGAEAKFIADTLRQSVNSQSVFIDIARHGKGDSVRQLRTHGIDANRINELVIQLGWSVLDRQNV